MKKRVIFLVLCLILFSLASYFFIENVGAIITDYNLSFVSPTPGNASITNKIEINTSIINASDLRAVNFNWNGTNYTVFNNSLILMMNFDNVSALGENSTYVADLSGNGNNGTVVGATWNSSGRYGGAYEFNGSAGRYINISSSPSLNITGELTVAAWVYPKQAPTGLGRVIVDTYRYDPNSSLLRGWLLGWESGSEDALRLQVFDSSGNKSVATVNNFFSANMNNWTYVVAVFKPSQYVKVYINGVENVSGTTGVISQIAYNYSIPLVIGARSDIPGFQQGMWNGTIDEVRIWNRSLTSAEIQELYLTNLNKYAPNNWRLYVNQSSNLNSAQKITDGNYTYFTSVKDSVGSELLSETRSVDLISVVSYSNFINNLSFQGQGAKYGDTVLFNTNLSAVGGLAGYITSCNFTGNDSYVPISGTSYNLNITKIANLSEGSTGCCYVWFNDTLGNSNQTSNSCFNMKARTKINIDYTIIDHPISRLIFGDGLEMSTPVQGSIFNLAGYNLTYFPTEQSIGFTNIRIGGGSCESNYNWSSYNSNLSSPMNYQRWRNYSMDITGNEPTLCIPLADTNYNQTNTVNLVKDSIQNGFNITNWEMGNENNYANCNGTRNATCYALRAISTCAAMKQIKPDIKCGLVMDFNSSNINGKNWDNEILSLAGNYTDFVIPHYYSPGQYFDTLTFYSSSPHSYSFNAIGASNYSIRLNAKSDNCCEAPDGCYPTLQTKIDGVQAWLTNITTNTSYGSYNTSYNLTLSPGIHNITIDFPNDFLNSSDGCDKNLFVANLSIMNLTSEMVSIPVFDIRNWTYSFFAATDTYIKPDLNAIRSNINTLTNHSMNIVVTEYNFHYGTTGFSGFSSTNQYDWRENLFTSLMLNTWLQQNISQADVWSDLSTGYWRYVSSDGTVKYPLYYIMNLYSSKTGNYFVNYTTQDTTTYNSSTIISPTFSPSITNEPFLSIAPSKDTVKHEYDLAIVNRNQDDDELVQINMNNDTPLDSTTYVTVLTANNLSSHPYKDGINIAPSYTAISSATSFNYTIPKYSIVFFETGYNLVSSPLESSSKAYQVFTINQTQLESGEIYGISLIKNGQARFSFNNESHTIKLDNIINNTAIITVSSLPITFNLTVNETKKIDLNNDGYYDLQIQLKNLSSYSADLALKFIKEAIAANTTGEKAVQEKFVQYEVITSLVIGLVALLAIILASIKKKYSKKK